MPQREKPMRKLASTLLICLALIFSYPQAQGNQGKRLTTRLAQALGFKIDNPRVMLLTTALVCTTLLSCSGIKPSLYNIGLLTPSSAMQAETIAEAVLTAQRNFKTESTSELQTIRQHAYIHKPTGFGYKTMLVEIVKEENNVLTVHGYADKFDLTIHSDSVKGYLIDDHPNVGRVVKLVSEAVGIARINGVVFAVYSNGIHAIKITSKTTLEGEQEELDSKKDTPHIRLIYEYQLQ